MKLSLEHVDTRGLLLELPGGAEQSVKIASTSGLRGAVAIGGGTTTLSGVQADAAVLTSLRLLFGDLVLSGASGATLAGLGVTLEQSPERLALDVRAASLAARELGVEIDDVRVQGRVELAGAKLTVDDGGGEIFAERAAFEGLSLRLGEIELAADEARGTAVMIGWGRRGFRLAAGSLEASALRLVAPAARVVAEDVALSGLSLDRGAVAVNRGAAKSARIEATFGAAGESGAAASGAPSGEPLMDLGALDALGGQLDVDVEVDLTVPIIGRRRATHRLRVAIEEGAIDFRALERNLAPLEDALLDFSVRDGALVLERVNPLFPARGHGKPVVAWPLDAADLELAGRDRVRLSVLPDAMVVGKDEPGDAEPPERKKSAIALRHLGLVNIDARLALAPISAALGGQLRPKRLGALTLQGEVHRDPGDAKRQGALRGEASELAASVHGLQVGARTLDAAFEIAKLTGLEVAFAGVTPTSVALEIAELVVVDLALPPGGGAAGS